MHSFHDLMVRTHIEGTELKFLYELLEVNSS